MDPRDADPGKTVPPVHDGSSPGESPTRPPIAPAIQPPVSGGDELKETVSPDEPNVGRIPGGIAEPSRTETIGPYRIVGRLGEGGMGTVYRAEQYQPIRRSVAIKVVRAEYASDQIIARFEAERQALARMDHPNISKVLDAGSDHGRPYFVMELAPGVPVTRFCDENKLSIEARLELFIQICDAIAHAHTKAILHRDIKSSNVLAYFADGKPTVKVIDFGIAKAMTDDRLSDRLEVTQMGMAIGTYEAMSPEQATGSLDIDTRTDVYALGVLLYELLSGTKPFSQSNLAAAADYEIRRIIREVDPPRPSTQIGLDAETTTTIANARDMDIEGLKRQLRSELEWIPLKAMRKDRDRRYASPLELAEDVRNYLADRPLLAGPESRAYRLRKYLVRNRAAVISAMATVLLLIAGISFYIHNIRAEQRRTAVALADATAQKAEAQRQRDQAQRANAEAEGVINFQNDMLSQADPERHQGDRVTVVEAMTAAIKKMDDGDLKAQPLVEQRVRQTVADTLSRLGRYDEAERQARLSVDLARRHLSGDDRKLSMAVGTLGNVLRDSGRPAEAEPLLREALTRASRVLSPGDRSLAGFANNLAMAVEFQGKNAEAEAMFRDAVAINRRTSATRPADRDVTIDLAASLTNLGGTLKDEGKFPEAEASLREAKAVARRGGVPPEHPYIANGAGLLADVLIQEGRVAEAEPFARESLRIDRKVLPPDHPAIVEAMAGLANVLSFMGQWAEAEQLRRDILDANRRAKPTIPSNIDDAEFQLGGLLFRAQRFAQAEPLLREAVDHASGNLPAEARIVAEATTVLTRTLRQEGKGAECEAVVAESLRRCRASLPPAHPAVIYMLLTLNDVRLNLGRPAEAETGFREAYALIKQNGTMQGIFPARAHSGLGRSLLAQGKPAEALPLLQQALDEFLKGGGPAAPDFPSTGAEPLATALDQLGRHDEAKAIREKYPMPPPATAPSVPATAPATRNS